MEKKRSVGVTICSIILLAWGSLLIAWVFKQSFRFGSKIFIDTFHFIILASGILSVAASTGLYMLLEWVRKVCVSCSVLSSLILTFLTLYWVIGGFLSFTRGGEWGFFYAMMLSPFLILSLYLLIFLTRPKVKEQFK